MPNPEDCRAYQILQKLHSSKNIFELQSYSFLPHCYCNKRMTVLEAVPLVVKYVLFCFTCTNPAFSHRVLWTVLHKTPVSFRTKNIHLLCMHSILRIWQLLTSEVVSFIVRTRTVVRSRVRTLRTLKCRLKKVSTCCGQVSRDNYQDSRTAVWSLLLIRTSFALRFCHKEMVLFSP